MKKALLIVVLAAAVAGALVGINLLRNPNGNPGEISLSGNIEVTEVELSFRMAGWVESRLVSEGETVTAGTLVARLDRTELLQAVALRRAEVGAAGAALAELEAGTRPEEIAQAAAAAQKAQAFLDGLLAGSRPQEVAAAEATLERARTQADYLEVEYERAAQLYNQGSITKQDHDTRKAAHEEAVAALRQAEANLALVEEGPRKEDIEQARAAVAQAQAGLELARKGPRKETIDQARARLEQAAQSLGMAQTRLDYATLVCPISGVVLSQDTEAGEYVSPGTPIVTVADVEHVWLRAYINESDLGRVKLGQAVRITTDTYPGKAYDGRLSFISAQAEFTPKNIQTRKERVKLVYRMKIDIANPLMELKPGMPADATILLSPDGE